MFATLQRLFSRRKPAEARPVCFDDLRTRKRICLYAGDVPQDGHYTQFTGLSLSLADRQHIQHDITTPLALADGSVDLYQAEDVFEHIALGKLPAVIDEIYRVLKPGGLFRLSLPDYRCDILEARTLKNEAGEFQFDPGGGGAFVDGQVVDGGHLWFPRYETVRALLEASEFTQIEFHHYYDASGNAVTKLIDYSVSHVKRTPDHDTRVQNPYRPMSIVVDCIK